ncbi:uncharacterized protein BDZ83DRAFT_207754 [Colletotrichum acutatum]|uniref:Uncharacterized protein n=1 Tax=Glomerella acutata TaxID=27357 RepID=A0AAD8U9C3_GLOAC|nr:uncharacterized protein BDZ83DRAFT_207754 [Colletotrichum acutatum]KAK1705620.1 hypothetical protein BDZ83DRAFT_207754 [Colletotrichum acutatum]
MCEVVVFLPSLISIICLFSPSLFTFRKASHKDHDMSNISAQSIEAQMKSPNPSPAAARKPKRCAYFVQSLHSVCGILPRHISRLASIRPLPPPPTGRNPVCLRAQRISPSVLWADRSSVSPCSLATCTANSTTSNVPISRKLCRIASKDDSAPVLIPQPTREESWLTLHPPPSLPFGPDQSQRALITLPCDNAGPADCYSAFASAAQSHKPCQARGTPGIGPHRNEKGGQRDRAMSTLPDLHPSGFSNRESHGLQVTGHRAREPPRTRTMARHSMPWPMAHGPRGCGRQTPPGGPGIAAPPWSQSRCRTLSQVPFFLSLVLVPKFHGVPKTNRRLQDHASLSVPDHDHRAANFQRKIDPIPNLLFADAA